MNHFDSLTRIRLIAGNTFLEAVRQKFFNALLFISIVLLSSATFFQQFNFGAEELKFITDFGFGVLVFFGAILSITVTAQLFFNEIENKTALTILAKPVHRLEFLAGKFLGAQMLMLGFTFVICLILGGILYWRESVIVGGLGDSTVLTGPLIRYGDVFLFGFLQWMKFGILTAITLFISSFASTSLYTIVVSFFVWVICQLQYIAREARIEMEAGVERTLLEVASLVFPNFELFNIGEQMVFQVEQTCPPGSILRITAYGFVYAVALILLAQMNFCRREI